ncbi:MAG: DUF3237 domain-containing protein [Pseudomonadales bacterium]
MNLEFLMDYHADLAPAQPIGKGPLGTRSIHEVIGGTFAGPRLRGEVLTCGGDWLLTDDTGVGRLDVRATFRTHDGAHIYMQYFGIIELNDQSAKAVSEGGSTEYGEHYFATQPRFETGDARYGWLNRIVAVAEGRIRPNAVEYRVYACNPGV